MLSIRTKLAYPQTKMAALLRIADKSYKNYELEKRELPLSVAANFCDEFEVDLNWLVYGIEAPDASRAAQLAGETTEEIFRFTNESNKKFSAQDIQKYARYVFEQCLAKNTSPKIEAELFFRAIG